MPIPLGILAAAGVSPAAAGSYDLLETTILGSSAAAIEFTNLATKYASTYQHLQIRYTEYYTSAGNSTICQLNGDTAGNYNSHGLWSGGTGPFSSYQGPGATALLVNHFGVGHTSDTNIRTVGVIDFLDAFETTKNTTMRSFYGQVGSGANIIGLHSGLWRNTAALTSLKFMTNGSMSFATGTRFSIYGLKGA